MGLATPRPRVSVLQTSPSSTASRPGKGGSRRRSKSMADVRDIAGPFEGQIVSNLMLKDAQKIAARDYNKAA